MVSCRGSSRAGRTNSPGSPAGCTGPARACWWSGRPVTPLRSLMRSWRGCTAPAARAGCCWSRSPAMARRRWAGSLACWRTCWPAPTGLTTGFCCGIWPASWNGCSARATCTSGRWVRPRWCGRTRRRRRGCRRRWTPSATWKRCWRACLPTSGVTSW